jgi:hypothetical protein
MSHDPLCELSQVECGCACAEWLRKHDYRMKGGCDNCGCLCDLIGKVREDQKNRDRRDMAVCIDYSLARQLASKSHADAIAIALSQSNDRPTP